MGAPKSTPRERALEKLAVADRKLERAKKAHREAEKAVRARLLDIITVQQERDYLAAHPLLREESPAAESKTAEPEPAFTEV